MQAEHTMTAATDNLAERIIGRIVSGDLAPGTQLVERALAEELGVSRIPVREALKSLVVQGMLVGGEKGQGVRVRKYSPGEVQQLFEYRSILEGGAARAAARACTPADRSSLDFILRGMEVARDDYGSLAWAERDRQFHRALVAASHNERLIRPHELLLREWNYVFYQHPALLGLGDRYLRPAHEVEQVLAEHREIARHIAEGNGEEAERAVRNHIEVGGRRIARVILEAELRVRNLDPGTA